MPPHQRIAESIARQIAGMQLDLADLLGRTPVGPADSRRATLSAGDASRIVLKLEEARASIAAARRIAPPFVEGGRGS